MKKFGINEKSPIFIYLLIFASFAVILSSITLININNYNYFINYLIFSILFNLFPILTSLFFHSYSFLFLSFFMWCGFYLTFSIQLICYNKSYFSKLNNIDFSNYKEINEILEISIISIVPLIIIFFLSRNYKTRINLKNFKNLYKIYFNYKKKIIFLFLIFLVAMVLTNFSYDIYNRFILYDDNIFIKYFYSYIFQIFLFSFFSYIIFFETLKKNNFAIILIFIFSSFLIFTSILSREYIIFVSFFIFIFYFSKKNFLNLNFNNFIILFIYVILVVGNFYLTNLIRDNLHIYNYDLSLKEKKTEKFNEKKIHTEKKILPNNGIKEKKFSKLEQKTSLNNLDRYLYHLADILINRFVGINEISKIYHLENKGLELFLSSIVSKNKPDKSFFNRQLFDSDIDKDAFLDNQLYKNIVSINLPGFVGFLYYSNSKIFIFISLILISILLLFFERIFLYLSGNPYFVSILCYLNINKIVHFGHNPLDYYKTIIAILITVFLFKAYNKFLYIK